MNEIKEIQSIGEILLKTKLCSKDYDKALALASTAVGIGLGSSAGLMAIMKGDITCTFGNRVMLSAGLMNSLVRRQGHVIEVLEDTEDVCKLKGVRGDNGNEMISSFSMDEARRAGLIKNCWKTYPSDMLFARALSRLCRRLFNDAIGGCYIEGEIPSDQGNGLQVVHLPVDNSKNIKYLNELLGDDEGYNAIVVKALEGKGFKGVDELPSNSIESMIHILEERKQKRESVVMKEEEKVVA